MKDHHRVLVSFGVLIVLVLLFYGILSNITKYTGFFVNGEYDNNEKKFARCLDEKNILLFINSAEGNDALKNLNVLDFAPQFDIYNCARDNAICLQNGVNSFPTFFINGKKAEGNLDITGLSEASGCRLVN